MSPSSKGILTGLLLAAPVILATLSVNEGWLLPAVDETGVAYLLAAPAMAVDEEATLPWAMWDSEEPVTAFEGRAPLMPRLMAVLLPIRPQPHVAALWTLAGAAGLVLLFSAWAAGGAAGFAGGVAAGLLLIISGAAAGLVTAIRPEIVAMVFVALQLGLMTYKPRWTLLHGAAAGGAWMAHPAGIGAVLAAGIWGVARKGSAATRALAGGAALAVPLGLLLFSPDAPPGRLTSEAGFVETARSAGGALLTWAGGGWGTPSLLVGSVLVPAFILLALLDHVETPTPPSDVHWKDPAAADLLAGALRPAALLVALCLITAALAGYGSGYGSMAAPWALALVPICTLAGATLARVGARQRGDRFLITAFTVLWLAASGLDAARVLRTDTTEGRALTHRDWVASEIIRWVDNRSDPWPVLYTDQPALLQIQSGRASDRLPAHTVDLTDFDDVFGSRPGALILTRSSDLTPDDYMDRLDLRQVMETEQGWVLVPN